MKPLYQTSYQIEALMVARVSDKVPDLRLLTQEGTGRIGPILFTLYVQPVGKKEISV